MSPTRESSPRAHLSQLVPVRLATSRRAFLGGLAAVGLVTATGCRSAVNEATEESGPAGEPVRGGTLVASVVAEPVPAAYFTGRPGNIFWCRNVLETLVLVDRDGEVHPLLATDWEFSDDNTTCVLQIREGVSYHSGRELTSDDVVFALEHAMAGGGLSNLVTAMAGWSVAATGDHEVTVTSPLPLQEVLFDILDATPIIDQETYEGLDDGSEVIGTGPFVWSEYDPGVELKMVRNESYWEPELPYLDAIELVVISDSTAALAALRTGRTHVVNGLSVQDAETIVDDVAFHLKTNHGLIYAIGFDVTLAPFDDPRMRQAVGYAIDRERINDQVFGGLARATSLPWGELATGYPEDLTDTYHYDPDRARELIGEAGQEGAAIEIALHAQPVPQRLYQIIARDLEEVGLQVSPVELSVPDFEPRRSAGELGQAFLTWTAAGGLPPALMVDSYPDLQVGRNPSNYDDDEYARLVEELKESPDDEATAQRLRALSEHLQEEAFTLPYAVSPASVVEADQYSGDIVARYGRSMRTAFLTE